MNTNINPVLYTFYLTLRTSLGARMVHRRRRKSSDFIEIIFTCDALKSLTGRLNTRREAEECGFWIMCRRQTKRGHTSWQGYAVFQLFLTPVHPKKQHDSHAEEVTFEPITIRRQTTSNKRSANKRLCRSNNLKLQKIFDFSCRCQKKAVLLQPNYIHVINKNNETNWYKSDIGAECAGLLCSPSGG